LLDFWTTMYYNITMLNVFLIGLAAKKFWPPARARRKGGSKGEFRRARAFRRSEAEAVSFPQNAFEQSYIIPPISNFPIFARPIRPREARKGMETLARRARRGSPSAGSKSLVILSICFA
jgi:hypothetical protein